MFRLNKYLPAVLIRESVTMRHISSTINESTPSSVVVVIAAVVVVA